MRELVFNITAEHDGKQAYHYLRYCEHFSYALIVKMRHTENSLLLDGTPIRTIDRIKAGSVLKAYIPEGTYVSWIDFRELGLSVKELERIIHQEGQFMTNHGRTFGEEGAGFERANLALPQKSLEVQLERLVKVLKENGF